jgi:uncharacterized protein YdcH (DUF465 family)
MVNSSRHPAISKFPIYSDQIVELMKSDDEFASLCRDYEQIVCDIARTENSIDRVSGMFKELLQLGSELESDIAEWLERHEAGATK